MCSDEPAIAADDEAADAMLDHLPKDAISSAK
jgi:hypothetical protein